MVGVSALFPGSEEAERFWRNIVEGADLFSDVPESHWRIDDYYDADPRTPDKVYARRGGFLPDIDFSPMDFGIPPNVVPATDTAQLLALRVAQQVLEDYAGGDISGIDRERVSVVLGSSGGTEMSGYMSGRLHRPIWERGLRAAGLSDNELTAFSESVASGYTPWQENTFPGLLGNVIAGRIANRFDLGGTNCVVDAACASSLAAIEIALHELYLREADMVIAGGVDAFNDIFMFMCFAKVTALSRTGDCRPFSDQSDGTMLGEGLSMLALKRLDDAERDGDRIYAVIRGIGTSSDGRAKSIYAPSPDGQAKALRRAYEAAGYGPETVGLVEAHGTGTKAGDVAEFTALRRVFDESGRADRQWCAVGSVKSQVGHTKGAAGACGLFKTVMALHHKVLPPTIKIDRPNPGLEIESSPFYLSTQTKPWIADQNVPRRASVSAFGFGGTNFHITLEEYAGAGKHAPRYRSWDSELVVLGADSAAALAAQAGELAASLVDSPDMLGYLAHSTQSAYDATRPHRLAVVANSVEGLRAMLGEAAAKLQTAGGETSFSSPKGYYYSCQPAGPVALLFPGQGSQYVGMGADIPQLHEPALAPWELARAGLLNADRDLHDVVWPKTAFTEEDRTAQAAELTKTEWAQPGIGAHSLSLLSVVRSLGIAPVAVGGHSFGEVSALCAAGVISDDVALLIARARGALMAQAAASSDGAMCAVTAPAEQVSRLLGEWGLSVIIANHNAPNQVVLSGDSAAIADAAQRFSAAGMNARLLDVATAFHSEIVSSAAAPFASYLAGIPFGVPQVPVYANATAQPYVGSAEQMQATLANQIAQPVRFVEQVQAMWSAGARTFVEVGPGSVLTNLVGKCLTGQDHVAVSLDAKGRNGIRSLWMGLGQLVAAGVPMNFEALWADYRHGDDPRTRPAPKLTMKLNGTNFGRPDINDEPVSRAAEKSDRFEKSTPRSDHNGHATVSEPPMTAAHPTVPAANGLPAHVPTHVPVPVQAAAVPMVTSPLMSGPGAEMVTHMVGALGSMQQTIAHLQGLLQTLVSSTGMTPMPVNQLAFPAATTVVPAQPVAAYGVAAPPAPPVVAPPPAMPAPPTAPAAPISVPPAPALVPAAPAPVAAAAPVVTMPAPPAPAPVAAPVAVAVAPAPVASVVVAPAAGVDLVGDMLAVVADKTGYPVEMLDLSMALEADLGIDSIKRVEILSAVQDRVPSLPEVETATMAALVTLQEIVDYLQSLMGPAAAPAAAAPAPAAAAPAPVAPVAVAPAAAGVDLVGDMLAVVADKTGYPVEMLDLSMALEADLGIDSITAFSTPRTQPSRVRPTVDHDPPTPSRIATGPETGSPSPPPSAGCRSNAAPATHAIRCAGVQAGVVLE
ncbi:acyltransferase domain-containing protein [Mycobacterium sp. SVM_VP21]|nr:acyltransferase domain-containing protein [Mycobacterium sp. SVM_VP21]